MNKFIAVYTAFSLLAILIADEATKPSWDKAEQPSAAMAFNSKPSAAMAFNSNNERPSNDVEEIEDNLESELELKRMIHFVTPLMAIFQQQKTKSGAARQKRSAEINPDQLNGTEDFNSSLMKMVEEGRKRGSGRRPMYKSSSQPIQPDRSGYGYGDSYSSGSSYGGGGGGGSYGCCDKKDDLLPILALTALSLLLLYLIAIATTTTTAAGGRKKRSQPGSIDDNDLIDDENVEPDIELLDPPTWVSMVDELWKSGEDEASDVCALKALCRMNRLALNSPGSTGLAVSLSSVPLSYLLHHRHQSGFLTYLDASLMGRYGENCTNMFSSCPRLN